MGPVFHFGTNEPWYELNFTIWAAQQKRLKTNIKHCQNYNFLAQKHL